MSAAAILIQPGDGQYFKAPQQERNRRKTAGAHSQSPLSRCEYHQALSTLVLP